MKILNFLQVNEYLATSGQPKEEEFSLIAGLGYETVINLALPTAENAVPMENSIVTGLGMSHFHIPVIWETPQEEQFRLFVYLMEYFIDRKTWVHCALNMRVSCFVYLYRTLYQGIPKEQARLLVSKIWQPNEVWTAFIHQIEKTYYAKV